MTAAMLRLVDVCSTETPNVQKYLDLVAGGKTEEWPEPWREFSFKLRDEITELMRPARIAAPALVKEIERMRRMHKHSVQIRKNLKVELDRAEARLRAANNEVKALRRELGKRRKKAA